MIQQNPLSFWNTPDRGTNPPNIMSHNPLKIRVNTVENIKMAGLSYIDSLSIFSFLNFYQKTHNNVSMPVIHVKVGKEYVNIDGEVFRNLLDLSPIKEYKAYIETIETGEITITNLKSLALKAGVPYPLFFASKRICDLQLEHKNKNTFGKLPYKDQIKLGTRGSLRVKDIGLIIQDLGRKQEFLKRRVLPNAPTNKFIGSLVKKIAIGSSSDIIANEIRDEFEIDLSYLRTLKKEKVIDYLRNCIEKKGILVSFSSHNYMPQNLDRDLYVSGICIKDSKFPFIFINTRDGDEKPKILESDGRQIFTLLSMLVCVGMNEFILSADSDKPGKNIAKFSLEIASEIIIPKQHLSNHAITDLDSLREIAHFFCVTPSMLLYQLERLKKLEKDMVETFRTQLAVELKKIEPKHRRAPLPVTGFSKYNGHRFSREIIKAHMAGRISQLEVRNVLFRRGKKMDAIVWDRYVRKFKPI
jgi:Zn-dependent peptidase ImmA (M78 family)